MTVSVSALVSVSVFVSVYAHACLPGDALAFFLARLPCLLAGLPACLPVYLLACLIARRSIRSL
eukprot:11106683-Alexandrium_andersonii.AAC.1